MENVLSGRGKGDGNIGQEDGILCPEIEIRRRALSRQRRRKQTMKGRTNLRGLKTAREMVGNQADSGDHEEKTDEQ
ncbi:MAG: hypothetical protein A2V45_12730 [Candidatus Aminicenantes bacterium RBG_19FT_COMBO_58_17]|jgi:hypothetical protein|nr:MAG: hypothetical protein A2V45_12730 [Candidatus Aminicenantes bacterium RBG_19FT_COMBO_58_17]